jgi:hypothetical protein
MEAALSAAEQFGISWFGADGGAYRNDVFQVVEPDVAEEKAKILFVRFNCKDLTPSGVTRARKRERTYISPYVNNDIALSNLESGTGILLVHENSLNKLLIAS